MYEVAFIMDQFIIISSSLEPKSPSPLEPKSPSPALSVRTRPLLKARHSRSHITEEERQAVNQRIRLQSSRPHAGLSALSTRDHGIEGRTSSPPPWDVHIILIRETFIYTSELDRLDGAKSQSQRIYIGIVLLIFVRSKTYFFKGRILFNLQIIYSLKKESPLLKSL